LSTRCCPTPATAKSRRQPPPRDPPQRLEDDIAAHLRFAGGAFDEGDRHLDDPKAEPVGSPGQLDLEAVPKKKEKSIKKKIKTKRKE
jgi:hypothetical protein